jgi:serine/threonine protein kinase
MTPERWQKVKEIFQATLDRAPEDRSAFLASACGGDESLRKEVESLLAAHEKDGSFIDSPAYQAAAELLVDEKAELKPGQVVGSYEIVSFISRGGMGEVYLAQDKRLGRKVALKVLPSSVTKDANRLRRFEQEARAASSLNHPNILTIHEIGEADGRRFITTEFVDGETLRQRISSGQLELGEALSIAEQAASAHAVAHAVGIIHRDTKPEIIMLRRDGIVKVLDFGLAKLMEEKQAGPDDATRAMVRTSPGVVMGTVAYMSPEQARGLSVDARTDIWSLGVVLYEMLTGCGPFAGATSSDTLVSILEREPRSLNSYSPELPEALEWIVTKALTKDCDDRYQTARELLTDLRRLKQRLSVAAELERSVAPQLSEGSAAERATSPNAAVVTSGGPRSNRRLVWTALLMAMVAVLATAVVWKGRAYWFKHFAQLPVVVLMDSPLPDRVYDPETRKNGGTNADDITDILRDLPIVIEKENTSPLWHREDQVLRESPALIVIHRSCFADTNVGFDPQSTATQIADKKIESFLGYISLGNPNTKFLVYTRRSGDQSPWTADMEKRFPQLAGRVRAVTVPGGPEHATFRDPNTAKMVRQQVQSILGLP